MESILGVPYENKQAPYFANCYAQLLLFKLKIKDKSAGIVSKLLKDLYPLREAARKMNLQGAAQYIAKNNMDKDLSLDYIAAVEMNTVARYTNSAEEQTQISGMFNNFCMIKNLDLNHFALACQALSSIGLDRIDMVRFEELTMKLESLDKLDLNISLALATNYYFLFYFEKDRNSKKIVESGASKCEIITGSFSKIVEHLDCQMEVKILKYLEKSMEHFCNVILCIRNEKEEEQKIISHKRLQRMLINISSHYLERGVGYKDIEAQNLLWNFLSNKSTPWCTVLNCATVLIDSHFKILETSGKTMKLSKRIETVDISDVLIKSQEVLKSAIVNFEESKDIEQACVINHLLSLYKFHALNGQMKKSQEVYMDFYRLWKNSKLNENQMFADTFLAKALFATVQINQECNNKNSFEWLHSAFCHITQVKSTTAEFSNIYHQVFQQLAMYTYNYTINRMDDMMRYEKLVITIKAQAFTHHYFFRALEVTSMSAYWNLQMEKLNYAMVIKII